MSREDYERHADKPTVEQSLQQAFGKMADTPKESIWKKIHNVMRDVESVKKERVNTHFKYKFTGHEDVTEALRPYFLKHGIVRHVTVGETVREGSMLRLRVAVRWINIDCPTDFVESIIPAESFGMKGPDDQQTGKAISYAVKIAELKTFSLMGDYTQDAEATKYEAGRPMQAASMPTIEQTRGLVEDYVRAAGPQDGTIAEMAQNGVFPVLDERYQKLLENQKATMADLQKIRNDVMPVMARLSPTERKRLGDLDKMVFHNVQKAS